jgi:hypothetical protein
MALEGREGIKGSDWCLVVPEVEESGSRSALDIHGRLGRLMLDAEGRGKHRGDERMREWRELLVGWQSVLPLRYMSIIFLHHHLSSSLAHPTISCTHAYSRRQNRTEHKTTQPTDRQTDRQTPVFSHSILTCFASSCVPATHLSRHLSPCSFVQVKVLSSKEAPNISCPSPFYY